MISHSQNLGTQTNRGACTHVRGTPEIVSKQVKMGYNSLPLEAFTQPMNVRCLTDISLSKTACFVPKQRALWVFCLVLGFGILFLHTPTGLKSFDFPFPDAATMDRGVPKL